MGNEIIHQGDVLLYGDENGKEFVNVVFMEETFWLTQVGMAELFDSSKSNVSEHLSHIFEEEELDKASCMRKFGISEFSTKPTNFYNLDAIIAVGYRVNSKKATRFRQWATKTLKEYIQKGFVLNDDLMKNGRPFGKDYFGELLERIREIRASERRAYQKIADVFEQCSYDYDKNSETTKAFYAFVQNKLHYAEDCRGADFRAGDTEQSHDGAYHMEGRAGGENPQKRHAGSQELPERKGAVPPEPAGDHVHRLRRADGRGRTAHEYAGLAGRD